MKPDMIERLVKYSDHTRLLVDSGAFTAWKAGKKIELDDYCRFLESLPVKPWRYFTLDVIGDAAGTMKNYEEMLRRGFSPIPIFTRGEDPFVIEEYYKTSDVVGIGGLVGTKGNKGFVKGIMSKVGERKVHWLGFTNISFIGHFRPFSCDSSSCTTAKRFGQIPIYLGRGNWKIISRNDVKDLWSQELDEVIHFYGLSRAQLMNDSAWRNDGTLEPAIIRLPTMSYIRYSREIARTFNTKYFLALCNAAEMDAFQTFSKELVS
jgi:hypothetical protein